MQITVKRTDYDDQCTKGELSINGAFFCHTLEPVTRWQRGDISKKIQNETSIDAGTYSVIVDYSPHFGKNLPHICDVPLFEGVRIHGGNTARDTEGCILVGMLSNTDEISDCAECVATITAEILAADSCTIEIIDGQQPT